MADEGISTRPESPKKKIKSNTVTHSEAEPSNYPDYNMNVDRELNIIDDKSNNCLVLTFCIFKKLRLLNIFCKNVSLNIFTNQIVMW